jgi:uncharacterized protein YndB with AHSA1/START domain
MTRVVDTAWIALPPEAVYDYVTTAANWPAWHPSSVAVRGATGHSGQVGQRIFEDFVVAGRRGTAEWVVVEADPPRGWAIDGVVLDTPARGRVEYRLVAEGDGTRFERTFTYPVPLRYALIDLLVVRRRVRAESTEAVRRLAALLAAV